MEDEDNFEMSSTEETGDFKAEVKRKLFLSARYNELWATKNLHAKLEPDLSNPIIVLDSEVPETLQPENNIAYLIDNVQIIEGEVVLGFTGPYYKSNASLADTDEVRSSRGGIAHPFTLGGKDLRVGETNLNEERESTLKATYPAKKTATKRKPPGPKSKAKVASLTDVQNADHQDGGGMAVELQRKGKARKISKKDASISQPDGETSTGESFLT